MEQPSAQAADALTADGLSFLPKKNLFAACKFSLSAQTLFIISLKVFVTKFLTCITKFVTRVTKFLTCVTKFVIKIVLYDGKNFLRRQGKIVRA